MLPKIDVYSFGIILYELFFEENPYLNTSPKINFKKSEHHSAEDDNPFNIIFQVANNQRRPTIPFGTKEELSEWSKIYLINDYSQSDTFYSKIQNYISLMKECWAHDPSQRPSFSQILSLLISLRQDLL